MSGFIIIYQPAQIVIVLRLLPLGCSMCTGFAVWASACAGLMD